MTHWRPYLWGHKFLIKTDHFSLEVPPRTTPNYIATTTLGKQAYGIRLHRRIPTRHLELEADALSRRGEEDSEIDEAALFVLTQARTGICEDIRKEIEADESLSALRPRDSRRGRKRMAGARRPNPFPRSRIAATSPLLASIVAQLRS